MHEDGGGVWDETDALAFLEGAVFDMHHLYASLQSQFEPQQANEASQGGSAGASSVRAVQREQKHVRKPNLPARFGLTQHEKE